MQEAEAVEKYRPRRGSKLASTKLMTTCERGLFFPASSSSPSSALHSVGDRGIRSSTLGTYWRHLWKIASRRLEIVVLLPDRRSVRERARVVFVCFILRAGLVHGELSLWLRTRNTIITCGRYRELLVFASGTSKSIGSSHQ